jgi:XTP/dITP diphosphohydrolase
VQVIEKRKTLCLVLATKNIHKIREFRALLKTNKTLDVLCLIDFPHYSPPEETGSNFEENATLKALHAAQTLKHMVLADDSGLIVPAIQDAPGVHSARYAGNAASDLDNRKKLLSEMEHLSDEGRHAFFECCLVLASPQGIKKIAHGVCEGKILRNGKGGSGFGYDSIFVKHEYNKTFAELDEAVKNQISHRRKAFDKIQGYL